MALCTARARIVLLGVITIVPSLCAFGFVIESLLVLFGLWMPTQKVFVLQMIVLCILGLWSVVIGVYYAHHFLQNANIPSEKRTTSNAIALVGNLYEMPRYWYLHFYLEGKSDEKGQGASAQAGGK